MTEPHIIILGAGPAGLGAAFQLTRRKPNRVTILEEDGRVGGMAGSFDLSGFRVDYGSHRLHPSCSAEVLRDIRSLIGDDLLDRPRHGRILLGGRWIHFPLRPIDLILRLPPSFSMGVAKDLFAKMVSRNSSSRKEENFASVVEKGLGRTICRDFYFPYMKKIWGLSPGELSVAQARRRVSANSMGGMIRKLLPKAQGRNHFFYPRHGFGQVVDSYFQAAQKGGAEFHLNSRIQSVAISEKEGEIVFYEEGGTVQSIHGTQVWSTIPVTRLIRLLKPGVPPDVLRAAERIGYRGILLIYLVLEQARFSEYDAHYFPETDIPISRLSEPKNYNNGEGPSHLTVLCAEIPCSSGDPEWNKTDEELADLVKNAMQKAGIPVKKRIKQAVTKRFHYAYPIYRQGYEVDFDRLDKWLNRIDGLLTLGRQGLFVHDNAHHALDMAYSAVACLNGSGYFDHQRWEAFRHVFDTHVVED